jgi:photosystem II stability/assembly factor-like uncharacterized protein
MMFQRLVAGAFLAVMAFSPANAFERDSAFLDALPSQEATKHLLIDVTRAGERLVAVGEYGHVVLSDDNGATWRQAERVPTRITLTAVSFGSETVGWAVGHGTIILRTEDGGETWEMQNADPEAELPLMSVLAFDENRAMAVGTFNFAMITADGGASWDEVIITDIATPLDTFGEEDTAAANGGMAEDEDEFFDDVAAESHLNEIFKAADGTIFIAAEFGTVYRSRDGGRSFTILDTGYQGSFWGGLGLDDGTVMVFGMRGNVWRSDDGGDSWYVVPTRTSQSLSGGTVLDDGRIVLAGLGGAVIYSDDGGRSFTATVHRDRKAISAVAQGPQGQIVLFGEDGVVKYPDRPPQG